MKRSLKNLLRVSVLAMPAGAFTITTATTAVAADAAPADTGSAAASVRDVRGGSGHRTVTELGRDTTKKAGLTMALSRTLDGITAKCGAAARAAVPGLGPLPGMPLAPTTDYPVPMRDPSAVVLLNKQVEDPFGGMTTTGMSLDAAPGTPDAVPRLMTGVANCDAVRQVGGPVGGPAGGPASGLAGRTRVDQVLRQVPLSVDPVTSPAWPGRR
jgi:hypothetical protein